MESRLHQIALLHAENDDVNLLNDLLSDEPFDVVQHRNVHALANQQFESTLSCGTEPSTYCVVICARDLNQHSSAYPSIEYLIEELNQLTGRYKRVVVLAESMDEVSVCNYLSAGAHHVIPLNDSPRLMQARLIAGLREHGEPIQNQWHVGPYHFDLSRRMVMMDGKNLGLSPREFELARFLFEHRERVIPVSELLGSVWSLPKDSDSRRIDTAACRLRKKMLLSQNSKWQLRRLRREGYQLIQLGELT